MLTCFWLFETHGFSQQENWNGSPFRTPGDLSHPGMELHLWCSQGSNPVSSRWILYQWATGETLHTYINLCIKLDNFLSNNRKLLTNLGKKRIIVCIFKKIHIFKWKATDTGSGKTLWCSSGDLDVQIKAQSYQYSPIRMNQLQSLLVLSSMHNVYVRVNVRSVHPNHGDLRVGNWFCRTSDITRTMGYWTAQSYTSQVQISLFTN